MEFEKTRRDILVLINTLIAKEKIKDKVQITEEFLLYLNTFLGTEFSPKLLNHGCFSQPDFGIHFCNILAKNADRTSCSHCGHKSSRIGACEVNCHLSRFCTAAFAHRLGIGDKAGLEESIEFNYKKDFEELLQQIYDRLDELKNSVGDEVEEEPVLEKVEDTQEEVEVIEENVDAVNPEEDEVTDEEIFEEFATAIKEENMDREFLTVSEAAQYKNTSAPNIYSRISNGKLPAYDKEQNLITVRKKGQRVLVTRSDLDALTIKSRTKKNQE